MYSTFILLDVLKDCDRIHDKPVKFVYNNRGIQIHYKKCRIVIWTLLDHSGCDAVPCVSVTSYN